MTAAEPFIPLMRAIPIENKNVSMTGTFWADRTRLLQEAILPHQWKALSDELENAFSGAVHNFKVAAGLIEGAHAGSMYTDSDLAKFLEAVGHSLAVRRDERLEQTIDEFIEIMEKVQQPDGYMHTFITIVKPQTRWQWMQGSHELYCAGHMIEAAIAYSEATGKRRFLDLVCRFADYIDTVFGPEPEKLHGYDGHQEIELALVKLYRATGNEKYLKLSKYFIDERGREPQYFNVEAALYNNGPQLKEETLYALQVHLPVREQRTAVGHAVRAMYLYCGMVDVAAETGDQALLDVCGQLWKDVAHQMYITGGLGSCAEGEKFTIAYDLPNDLAYTETCAAIGLMMFAHRMLQMDLDSRYSDVMERALYNGVLSGISLDGKAYFYTNPMEMWPEIRMKREDKRHLSGTRSPWHGCACCPPNVARVMASVGEYMYSRTDGGLYVHLYSGNRTKVELPGHSFTLEQETDYPWDGRIIFTLSDLKSAAEGEAAFTLALRIPGYCKQAKLSVNGEELSLDGITEKGYAKITRVWSDQDRIVLDLPLEVERVYAHPGIRGNAGKVALQRGPVIYCVEEADNGPNLPSLSLPSDAPLTVTRDSGLPGDLPIIQGTAYRGTGDGWGELTLYRSAPAEAEPVQLTAVPYFAWSNREPGEMLVWIQQTV